ncbi:MAG: C-terminal binding protein [Clostridia bacterium]|nr:C-terminal binding protein [Clostridia bacterium]
MKKVVIIDHVFDNVDIEREVLKDVAEYHEYQLTNEEEVIAAVKDADVVMATNYDPINRRIIESMEKAKLIVRHGIGVDSVDLQAATDCGIMVVNVPNYCLDEVSDHAMALLLALERKIGMMDKKVRDNPYYKPTDLPQTRNMRGKTAGVVGFGRIGRLTGQKLNAFGVNVLYYDPFLPQEAVDNMGMSYAKSVSCEYLIENSDYIIVHAPLVPENYHFLNKESLALAKKKPYIINVGREGHIDIDALVDAINSGIVQGAGLDCVDGAPPYNHPGLLACEEVIITPHAAFYSDESYKNLQRIAAEQARDFLEGKMPAFVVNKAVLEKLK